tara:strand:- start:1255 stop:4131 length:2877 start_codon:yes stop_codon:yes gene_type:complete
VGLLNIPLDGGLVTQADPEDVGASACTELINAEFDKVGVLYKRKGRASSTSVSANIDSAIKWIYDGTAYWVIATSDGKVYITTNLASLGSQLFDSSGGVQLNNYGTVLRFSNGITFEPKIHQYIARQFFWNGYTPTSQFYTSRAIPEPITHSIESSGKSPASSHVTSALSHTTKTYTYKLTFIYDGNQETPIPNNSVANSKASIGGDVITADDDVFYFTLKFLEADWNPRVTGINIYRSENAGTYYKVASVSTLDDNRDLNLQKITDGYAKRVLVDSSNSLTSAINGKILYISGISHTIGTCINEQFASMAGDLSTDIGSQTWGTSTGHTNLTYDNDTGDATGSSTQPASSTAGWFVGEAIVNGTSGIYDTSGSTHSSWTSPNTTVSQATDEKKYGSNSLKFVRDTGSLETAYYSLGLTGLVETDSIMVSFWWLADNCAGASDKFSIGVGDTNSSIDSLVVQHQGKGSSGGAGDKDQWRYVQKEILLDDLGSYSNGDTLYLLVQIDDNTASALTVWLDNICVAKKVLNTTTGKLGYGTNIVASTSWDLGAENTSAGARVLYGSGTNTFVKKNFQYAMYMNAGATTQSTTATVRTSPQYAWRDYSGYNTLTYADNGDVNGIVHPYGETSIDVNFVHSINLEGRQYVADVALNPSAENELHKDWVMFSEVGQPDVIPITNYISIPDLQGGEIKGLAKLIGDLVVLQTKGIYRLSIPSIDPFGWSLSESEPNIGCIATDSIVEHEAGVFFAGKDHMYHLGANFQATPITSSIKDDYQSLVDSSTRTIIDVKKNRLLCKFSSVTTIYSLDLVKFAQGVEHWTKYDMSNGNSVNLFTIDEDLKVYTVQSGATSYLAELNPSSSSETTSFKRTTGWINFGNLDRSGVLRRLNMRYNSGDDLTIKFYVDGDSSTVVETITVPSDTTGADWYRCKPSVRCRYFMVEISSASSSNSVEIRKLEVEFE